MEICVVGGGNAGHLLCGLLGQREDLKINLLTRQPSCWKNKIKVIYKNKNCVIYGKIFKISSNPEEVISNADIILLTVPSFANEEVLTRISSYVKTGAIVGEFPGTGGFDWIARKILLNKAIIFGTQRLPYTVRTEKYGESVILIGQKKEIFLATLPNGESNRVSSIVSKLLGIPCNPLNNFLEVTLTPSNQILHTSRMYGLFGNWDFSSGIFKEKMEFYKTWDKKSLEILQRGESEIQAMCKILGLSGVMPLVESYPRIYKEYIQDKTNLLTMIQTNKAYFGITPPMKRILDGYIPDFTNRYITEDVPYGLVILKSIADILKISTPQINELLNWGQKILDKEYLVNNVLSGKDIRNLPIPQNFGINTKQELIKFGRSFTGE